MRKKILRTFAAALAISTLLVVPAYAETAVVTGNNVNFRSGPGTNYYVIATLERNTPVTVTDRSNGSWYAVSVGGQNGFISSAYLSVNEDSAVSAPSYATPQPDSSGTTGTSSSTTGYINAMYVRFRSGPGSDYSVLGEYNRGKEVTTIGTGDGWTACVIDGQLGYVYSQYVSTGYVGTTSSSTTGSTVYQPDSTPAVQPSFGIPQPDESVTMPDFTPTPTQTAAIPSPSVTQTPIQTVSPTPTPVPTQTPAVSSGKSGYINGTYVRFRSGPGTNYSILGTYHTGKTISVTADAGNGWYQCVIDGNVGYVYASYVVIVNQADFGGISIGGNASDSTFANPTIDSNVQSTPTPTATPAPTSTPAQTIDQFCDAYITGNNVRFRAAPSMTAAIIGEFSYGNRVSLVATANGWAQIVSEDGVIGYVSALYVKEGSYITAGNSTGASDDSGSTSGTVTPPQTSTATGATGETIANYACQFVGSRYSWGGTSPDTGFDCSGLVYYVYKQFGYTLNRVAADQATNGRHVEADELQPGDLICFYSGSSYIGHVGIYIGNGQFVHASNSTTGVIISELSGYYVSRGFEARRIVG